MKLSVRMLAAALLAVVLVAPSCATAQVSTREDLSNIRTGRKGKFRYWNEDSQTIRQLKAFVSTVTNKRGKGFVPVEDRIAVFDVDGTLFCETAPTYGNFIAYCQRVLYDDSYDATPEERAFVQEVEEYITVNHSLSSEWGMKTTDGQSLAFQGMTQQEYQDWFRTFFATKPVQGLSNLTWGTALYWPMIEVVSYLLANDFRVFICSGTDRDICRVLCEDIFEIPAYQFIGTDVSYVLESQIERNELTEMMIAEGYQYSPSEKFVRGQNKYLNTAHNKIASISREIGQKPILAWGNSSGDFPMFYLTTTDNSYPSVAFCNLCDDTEREFGNTAKAQKVKSTCEDNGWIPVSMRDEWSTIYGPNVLRTE